MSARTKMAADRPVFCRLGPAAARSVRCRHVDRVRDRISSPAPGFGVSHVDKPCRGTRLTIPGRWTSSRPDSAWVAGHTGRDTQYDSRDGRLNAGSTRHAGEGAQPTRQTRFTAVAALSRAPRVASLSGEWEWRPLPNPEWPPGCRVDTARWRGRLTDPTNPVAFIPPQARLHMRRGHARWRSGH